MYLSKIFIINYRSCRHINIDFLKDDPNIFIGVNDCGKTTVLKGIGLLLDEKPQFNFVKETASKKDISNSPLPENEFNSLLSAIGKNGLPYNESQMVVIGKLVLEEQDITEGNIENFSNHLAWAIECNSSEIWMARVFDTISNNVFTYLYLNDHIDAAGALYSFYKLGDRELQRKRREQSLSDEEIRNDNGVGRYSKLEIVRGLFNKLGSTGMWTEYKYEANFFPRFRYLDWNTSFEEIMKSATDAMSALISSYIEPVRQSAIAQAVQAQNAINARLNGIRDSIAEIVPITELKTRVQFNVQEKITDIFVNKANGDGDIHMDLQGDGLKRQIWFALVKASLHTDANQSAWKRFIWAFDEPETHLFPAAQRKLFDIIKSVSLLNVQSFISTHSTVFIDRANLSAIKCVHQAEHFYTEHYTCSEVDDVFDSLDVRNSDFLFFDKFLVIEGETEQHLIPSLYKLVKGNSLKDDNIQLINLHGASKWTIQKRSLENVLTGFKKSLDDVVYVFDNDQFFKIGTSASTGNIFFVGKQDIEDALDNEIWIKIVQDYTEGKLILTEDEIQGIKDSIPSNVEVKDRKKKFLGCLESLVRNKYSEILETEVFWDVLPTKGSNLAEAILKHLISTSQVPKLILKSFCKLIPELNEVIGMSTREKEVV